MKVRFSGQPTQRTSVKLVDVPEPLFCGARYLGLELSDLAVHRGSGLFEVASPVQVVLGNFLIQCGQGAGEVVGVVGASAGSLRDQVAEVLEGENIRPFAGTRNAGRRVIIIP